MAGLRVKTREDNSASSHGSRVRSARRPWVAIGAVVLTVGLSGCSGSGGKAETEEAGTAAPSLPAIGTPFDPPSRFDLTRAVPLTMDEATHGALYGTTFYSLTDSALHATNLATGEQTWSATPSSDSQQHYLAPPFVHDSIVVAVTAEETSPGSSVYLINTFGVDAGTGAVLWNAVTSPVAAALIPGNDVSEFCWAVVTDHDGDLLITLRGTFEPTSFFVDASDGAVLWQVDMTVFATASGPYALAAPRDGVYNSPAILSFDLRTGKTGAHLTDSAANVRLPVDPDGDDSSIVMSYSDVATATAPTSGPRTVVRFSSADSTVQSFVPEEEDDVRYQVNSFCTLEPGQTVVLCYDRDGNVYGVSATSGDTVWKMRLEMVTQYHGNVYGAVPHGPSVVVALDTGQTLSSDVPVRPLIMSADGLLGDRPIMVNQYGAVGMAGSGYVWAPASG